jgi:hypothetical protein
VQSTKPSRTACAYLGIDVTDRFSKAARPMDVCGLEMRGNNIIAHFWVWKWEPGDRINVATVLPEVRAARSLMLDAPQGLAQVGCSIRCSERRLGAAGKTADARPPLTQPYGGFIGSSLDLFAAFRFAGLAISPTSMLGICEVYPAAIWTRLARRIPNKHRSAGRKARVAILQHLGVALPTATPTHDQLDACAAALVGAAADGRVPGMKVIPVGDPVWWDATHECHREGPIMIPEIDAALAERLERVVGPWTSMLTRPRRRIDNRPRNPVINISRTMETFARPALAGATRQDRAAELFEQLVAELIDGRPTLCTYKAAVAIILGFSKYTPAYGAQLIKLATQSVTYEVDGLGEIKLDTFLVNQNHRPGEKHWEHATYSEAEWERAFFGAAVIE